MPHPDEGLIHEWLDGELDAAAAARVEALVASDPEWAAAVSEARGLVAASSRIVGALDHVPGGVVPHQAIGAPRRVPRWWMVRTAAVLVVVVGTVAVLRQRDPALVIQETPPPLAKVTTSASAPVSVPEKATEKASKTAPRTAATPEQVPPKLAAAAKAESGPASVANEPATRDAGAGANARQVPEMKKEAATASGLLSARTPTVSCYLVRSPPALAGRTVVHPADSGSRALWEAAGIDPRALVMRNDSLFAPAGDSARVAAASVIAVRSRCPNR